MTGSPATYDAAGQLLKIQKAYGSPRQQDYATYEYTNNGKQKTVIDANGNKALLCWDGHDRQRRWVFPSKTAVGSASTDCVSSAGDYEQYGYDLIGNRISLRKRDGRDEQDALIPVRCGRPPQPGDASGSDLFHLSLRRRGTPHLGQGERGERHRELRL